MAIGIPQPHVSEIERGTRRVTTIELIERVADGLGVPRKMLGLAELDDSGIDAKSGPVAESQREWLDGREFLGTHRADITKAVYGIYPEELRLGNTGILIPPQWRLEKPVDLAAVELRWQEHTPRPAVNGTRDAAGPPTVHGQPGLHALSSCDTGSSATALVREPLVLSPA